MAEEQEFESQLYRLDVTCDMNYPHSIQWSLIKLSADGIIEEDVPDGSYDLEHLVTVLDETYGENVIHYKIINNISDGAPELRTMVFTTIPEKCPNVQEFTFWEDESTFPVDFSTINICWKKLEKLKMLSLHGVNEEVFWDFLRWNPSIKSLTVKFDWNYHSDTDQFINHLSPETMEEISIDVLSSETMTFNYFIAASSNFTSLRSLSLLNHPNFDQCLADAIGEIITLENLTLHSQDYKFNDSDNFIAKLVNLKELKLTDNNNLTDSDVDAILLGCQKLEKLDLSQCRALTDAGFQQIGNLQNLRTVDFSSTQVTDLCFKYLPETVKVVRCRNMRGFTDDCVVDLLDKIPRLEILDLTGCERMDYAQEWKFNPDF